MKRISGLSTIVAAAAIFALPGVALAASPQLFISGDMVTSPPDGSGAPDCVLASQFKHGMGVVFRVRVLNDKGATVTNKELKSLVVDLSSGQKINLRYGGHPHKDPVDHFWSGAWKIPADFPSGSMSYKVVATMPDGTTQDWTPFKVKTSQLTILPGDVD